MDSLTQITLGAAVGEAVLGRRIGNRAMVWGAIAGTVPDLDVIANFFLEPIPALAFHRGITHSILFAVVMAALLAWLVHRLYDIHAHQRTWYKVAISVINMALLAGLLVGLYFLFGESPWLLPFLIGGGGYLVWRLYRYYLSRTLENPQASLRGWYILFFLALTTHFILDCFTAYGTQIFLPFSDYRVAFNTISVVDPMYTVPFLIAVIVTCNLRRNSRARRVANWTGIAISSAYLLFTVFNRQHVDRIFSNALEHRNLEVSQCRTSPTIFNNILWNCVAENDSVFYAGLYSLFDSDPHLHYLNVIPKNDHYAAPIADMEEYHILQWFSEGYLMHTRTDTALIMSDIRFGGIRDTIESPRDLVFNFFAEQQPDGTWKFSERRERPEDVGAAFRSLWQRILGR